MKSTVWGMALVMGVGAGLAGPVLADRVASEPIKPIEPYVSDEPLKVELGKKLFFDPRLSRSGFISCNSCHNLSMGGSDNLPTSIGHHWQEGPINSPTVLNSSLFMAQFWDGRAETLQEQAAGPIANPMEMASTHVLAIDVIQSIPEYRQLFADIYGSEEITIDEVTDAIAEFEETLVTPNSRFDQWLLGDDAAITEQELAGYELFKQIGCAGCHHGPAVGGTSFQRMGVFEEYMTNNPSQGRFEVTGLDRDRMSFKVPTLRNVELTYPYFHDGAYWTLEEATDIMATLQLGRQLDEEQLEQLVAFQRTLTGEQPAFALPTLPPSTADTPRPVPFETEASE
ncbi:MULTISPECIES: cytochrome-c peroxidase [Halomonadaceae]|uniref:cytochrome-c peroxidase n=1 Tax=Halomonadaceae TaxID=28256 RepID=UPI001597C040|nr:MULTISPECIES: cytochrome-c peroxidase [Halomonas]QJQ96586.1 cytochrome-c peroxidase [Halomonas sp. PA5]